jgi:hypothetical protein
MAIVPDLFSVDPSLRFALRDIIVVSRLAIPLDPDGIGMSAQPCGCGGGQRIQGCPHGLGHAGETVQGTDRSEHMCGVGTLAASGAQQLVLPTQDQKRIEEMLFQASCHQATAELAQNRGIEARVGQFQSQKVLPIDAAADRIGRPPI